MTNTLNLSEHPSKRASSMRGSPLWAALLASFCLTACAGAPESNDDAQDEDHIERPDAATVEAALQDYFDAHPQCTPFFKVPMDVIVAATLRHKQLQGFVDAGILSKSQEIVKSPGSIHPDDHVIRYMAGPRGDDIKAASGTWSGYGKMICYGTRQVQSVQFGDPDEFQRTVSVKYRYRLKNVPAWARQPALREGYPLFVQRLDEEDEGDEALKYEGKGWRLEKQQDNLGFDFLQQGH